MRKHFLLTGLGPAGVDLLGAPPPGGPIPQGPSIASTSILDWMRLAGDYWYSAPAVTYTAGDLLNAVHNSTGGAAGGWVIIVGQPGATIDESPPGTSIAGGTLTAAGDLVIGGTSTRIMLVGFKFINGTCKVNVPKIRLWYPDMKFPVSAWTAEPGFAGNSNYHDANRLLYPASDSLEVYGGTFHDSSTPIYLLPGASNTKVVGADISALDNGGYYDRSHPDCFADVTGNQDGITLTDSYLHPGHLVSTAGIQLQDYPYGKVQNIALARLWVTGAGNGGLVMDSSNTNAAFRGVFGTADNLRIWGCGVDHALDGEAFWNLIQYVDGAQINYTLGSNPQPLRVNLTATNSGTGTPQVGTDPATAWRTTTGHGLADWATFFAGNWP